MRFLCMGGRRVYTLSISFRAAAEIARDHCQKTLVLAQEVLPELDSVRLGHLLRSFHLAAPEMKKAVDASVRLSQIYHEQYQLEAPGERKETLEQMSAYYAEIVRGEYTDATHAFSACSNRVAALKSTVVAAGYQPGAS
ncbi:hypothetical protein ABZ915_09240 [Streptomyces sp. NPDC046915]|uniref:hypothetical protein n=1 Tax=Streptomyces sp. NPDC046915 TaxID=3155257 RepID=UPI0033CCF0F8